MGLKRIGIDIKFFSRLAVSEIKNYLKFRHPAPACKLGEKLVILGNGPSQKLYWDNQDKFKDYDLLCVNFFPLKHETLFLESKPRYICLCDPLFFGMQIDVSDLEYEKKMVIVENLWSVLEKVDWECYLIYPNTFLPLKELANIKKLKLTILTAEYYEHLNKFYLKNIVKPDVNGVVSEALYMALVLQYRKIALFGVESNLLWTLKVNENNDMFFCDDHSYGSQVVNRKKTEKGMHVHKWILREYKQFKGFYSLSLLAKKNNIAIVNYCVDSYIDVFEKKRLDS